MDKLTCAICNEQIDLKPPKGSHEKRGSKAVHDHYQKCLARWFEKQDFKVIVVEKGGMPSREGWAAPDIFLLKGRQLAKVVEVISFDPYEDDKNPNEPTLVVNKCRVIKEYYDPPEIIVFEPVRFLDENRLPKTKAGYKKRLHLSQEPTSYRQIEAIYQQRWKEQGLEVNFWTEDDIKKPLV
jgi:hypothetical protein